jgi:2-keto-4-pentenoate hydratase/2-oxohepta-3-ene-1,7-dioic acid hydratase in catechol pathway
MAEYKLLTYQGENGPRAGLLVADTVYDLQGALDRFAPGVGFSGTTTLEVLGAWDAARPVLGELAAACARGAGTLAEVGRPLAGTRLRAPILYPGNIFGACANYVDHAHEMRGEAPPDKATDRPRYFTMTPLNSVIGPGETARLPAPRVHWEAEIGVVIGRPARRVSAANAMEHVAGYTIVNDLSLRQPPAPNSRYQQWFGIDWFRIKCFDTSAPMGPWITPADQVPDPHNLRIQTWVNDEVKQDGSSQLMWFTIPEQIEFLSEELTLRPGDVISTGTCQGVGGREGTSFLKGGDRIRMTIGNLGTLETPCEEDYIAAPA